MLSPVFIHTCRAQQGYDASAYGAAQAVQYDAYGQPIVYDTAMQVGIKDANMFMVSMSTNVRCSTAALGSSQHQHAAAKPVHTCQHGGCCWRHAALCTVVWLHNRSWSS